MRRTVLSLAFLLASAPVFAGTWSDLWLTPDQQGQRLLDAGDAARAAKQFQDPRLRAYADVKAGNYNSAAEQLAPLKDVDSLYNRGNALARAGKLKDALAAYNAALAKEPDNRDARHNRDLIERQLQKNKGQQNGQGQQGKGQKSGSGKQSDSNQQDGGNNQQQGNNGQQSSQQGKSGKQDSQNAQQNSQQNAQQKAQEAQQDSKANQREGSSGQQQKGALAQNNSQQGSSSEAPTQNGGTNDGADRGVTAEGKQTDQQQAAAARRDAEAALQRGKGSQGRVAKAEENRKPTSEQAIAREQWLRRIPDDPGGLLRRKFMVEHMKKQQESGQ
jgi:Ca-activated chloride channel family protein